MSPRLGINPKQTTEKINNQDNLAHWPILEAIIVPNFQLTTEHIIRYLLRLLLESKSHVLEISIFHCKAHFIRRQMGQSLLHFSMHRLKVPSSIRIGKCFK